MTTAITLPVGIRIEPWAAALFQDFPTDDIPILNSEQEWRPWGDSLIVCTTFAAAGSPGTAGFDSWQDWALAVVRSLNA